MKLRVGTLIWGAVACVAITVVSADPRRQESARRVKNAVQRPQDRVFPEFSERQRRAATLEFVGAKGPVIRLVPGAQGGHELFVGDEVWGPASEEAVQNAWSNLRMARVIRELDEQAATEVGRWGAITLHIGDSSLTLRLGKQAADASGVYAQRESQSRAQLVDGELTALVQSPPELWLRRSMLGVEVGQVARVQWSGAPEIARGADGRWRVRLSKHEERLLNSSAVDLKLGRLLHAPLREKIERSPEHVQSLRPWLSVVDANGISHHVMAGGACPEHPSLRVIDRGPGLLGCVEASMLEPWTFVSGQGVGLVELKLVPHRYGQWAGLEQTKPQELALRRRPGRWEMAMAKEPERFSVVSEPEVYRWYRRLGEMSLRPAGPPITQELRESFQVTFEAELHFDGGQRMQLRCGELADKEMACQRDLSPLYRMDPSFVEALGLSFDALADRQILNYAVGSVRGIEIKDRQDAPDAVARQAAHLDYGEWKLSAPEHPDADGALDQVRLEALLSTLADLRASTWLSEPSGEPMRVIELDYVPGLAAKQGHRLELFGDCAVRMVQGPDQVGRTARLDAETCKALFDGILYQDPVASVLRNATKVEVELYGEKDQIQRRRLIASEGPGQGWGAPDLNPKAQASFLATVQRWRQRRLLALRNGVELPSPRLARLHVQRFQAPPVTLDLGKNWVQIQGKRWWMLTDEPASPAKR